MSTEKKVYVPDGVLKQGLLGILSDILREIIENRWLIFQLAKRDLISMYRQSFAGVFWAFLLPAVTVAVFFFMSSSGVLNTGEIAAPYGLYALYGIVFWQVFSNGVTAATGSLVKAGTMVVKINFSRKALVISSFGQAAAGFFVQYILLLAALLYYGYPLSGALLVPLFALPVLALSMAFGFILSILNGISRDTASVVNIGTAFLLFLTPVVYARPAEGFLAGLSVWNPLYYLTAVPRDYLLLGDASQITCFLWTALFSVAALIFSVVLFHVTEKRITERI